MAKVTSLEKQARRSRYNVFLDGRYAFSLAAEVAGASRVEEGQDLTEEQVQIIKVRDTKFRLENKALRFLGYRARSEKELQNYLTKHLIQEDLPESSAHQVKKELLTKFRRLGYLDDEAFAKAALAEGQRKLWGAYRIRQDLKQKGVGEEVLAKVLVVNLEEERQRAQELVAKKAKSYRGLDYWQKRRRLGEYLARRGFSWEIIKEVVGADFSNLD